MNYEEKSIEIRKETGGQIYTGLKGELKDKEDLSVFYTPGIAGPCKIIAEDREQSKKLTIRKNTIAVVSDGSAVLGLGNIGPEAALPVMEGKSMLFKQFAGIDAIPLVLDTQNTDEIVEIVSKLAPTFGGINLEDISAPRCFEIEKKLSDKLNIPVFHDDQHGTAMVVLAALKNSLKIVKKKKEEIKVVISGAGAAGLAIAELLSIWGVKNIELIDSKGVLCCQRDDLNGEKRKYCNGLCGDLKMAMKETDVFIGVSKGGIVNAEMVKSMSSDAIVFAMANPYPEIMSSEAKEAGARIVATGRSDFPNQINNVLIFPGFFRGLLDNGIVKITKEMKIKAAEALADTIDDPRDDYIIPSAFDEKVVKAVSQSLK